MPASKLAHVNLRDDLSASTCAGGTADRCASAQAGGMSYGDYVEQLTPSPSPSPRGRGDKRGMADERTKPPYNQPSAVPAKYNWPTLLKKDGDDLFDHYRHMLESLGNEKGLLGLNRFSTFRHPLAVTIQLS